MERSKLRSYLLRRRVWGGKDDGGCRESKYHLEVVMEKYSAKKRE